jgi:hypothetical protein
MNSADATADTRVAKVLVESVADNTAHRDRDSLDVVVAQLLMDISE